MNMLVIIFTITIKKIQISWKIFEGSFEWLGAWFCFVVSLISQVVTTPLDHGHDDDNDDDDDYDDDDNLDDDDDDDEVGVLC